MPTNLKSLGVQKDTLEKLALDCSRNKTRTLIGYRELEYDDILEIYKMAYDNGNVFNKRSLNKSEFL